MDSLDLDQVMDEIIPRGDNRPPAPNFPVRQRPRATDDATAALDLVSQAAAARPRRIIGPVTNVRTPRSAACA